MLTPQNQHRRHQKYHTLLEVEVLVKGVHHEDSQVTRRWKLSNIASCLLGIGKYKNTQEPQKSDSMTVD